MALKLFIEHMSQPSRAVMSLILQEKIPHELINIRLSKLEHKTESFKSQFPLGTVPSMSHSGINLSESHAILVYLCENFKTSENWYPKQPDYRAKVNEYLHWHHSNTRKAFGHYIYNKFMGPAVYNRPVDTKAIESCLSVQEKVLKYLESSLNSCYIANTPQPTIADLSCYCEVSQMKILKFDFSGYSNIKNWADQMESLPGVQESHKVLNSLLPKMHEKYHQFIN